MGRSPGLWRGWAIAWVAISTAGIAPGAVSFWVWNRFGPLMPSERQELAAAGVSTLYWHAAEIENRTGQWEWKRPFRVPQESVPGLRVVPVIRLESTVGQPFSADGGPLLAAKLVTAFQTFAADEWQLDYDAPDRLVGDYAAFLASLRPQAPKLTSTALAGWVRLPAFPALQDSVAGLSPMFYDLEPDTASALRPLIEGDSTRARLAEWAKACRIPWQAGLPWFARLSVYGPDGRLRGHFRQWHWDDVVFRRECSAAGAVHDGLASLRVEKSSLIENRRIEKGDFVVGKWVDLAALRSVETGLGRDVIFFRLADGSASAGWSLRQFSARAAPLEVPVLSLQVMDNHLILRNEGRIDLAPRIEGDTAGSRGYGLELDAAVPVFREAEAGAFAVLEAVARPESPHPRTVPVTGATRLIFRFGALPAGAEIRSGFLQFAPGMAVPSLRWRVFPAAPVSSWNPLVL